MKFIDKCERVTKIGFEMQSSASKNFCGPCAQTYLTDLHGLIFRCYQAGGRRFAPGAITTKWESGQHRHRTLGDRGEQPRAHRPQQRCPISFHIFSEV